MKSVRISPSYQVSVPKEVLKSLALAPGDELRLEVKDGAVIMKPVTSQTSLLFGHDKDIWAGVDATRYVRDERLSWRD
jgi:AbrB family looped-hinge helix DNA binding protein